MAQADALACCGGGCDYLFMVNRFGYKSVRASTFSTCYKMTVNDSNTITLHATKAG